MAGTDKKKVRKIRGPIAYMVHNSIAANLLMIILLGGGIWTMYNVRKEVFPQFQLDIVQVSVTYPGATPAEVEKGILLPVEEAIRGLQGIKEVTSTANEGSGTISIELIPSIDNMKAFQDIEQAVNRIRTFPDDIEEPEVQLLEPQTDVMQIAIYGDIEIPVLRNLAEQLRDLLLSNPSITQVELGNVPDYMTHVEIPRRQLQEYGLTLRQVADMIVQSSEDIPAGTIETQSGEILLRLQERKQWAEEFGKIKILTSESGASILLEDIAQITDGFEEIGFHGQFNQQPSIDIEIFRVGAQSPLEIEKEVLLLLDDFERSLPPGVQYRIDSNNAEDYRERLSLLTENGILAVVIVLIILALFLEFKLAFWVMLGMAISFIGGMLFMPLVNLSLNMITMFGFLVVLGIVVDDAIVVGENIYEYRQQGMGNLQAAIHGARDIAKPVFFSILTNVIAFFPLLFIPGTTGKFWWPLPAIVIVVLVVSLLEALFILPTHLAHSTNKKYKGLLRHPERWQKRFANGFNRYTEKYYKPFLKKALRSRYITFTSAVVLLLIVGGYGYSDHMGLIMMPEVSADEIEAGVRLPVGTTPEQASLVAQEITQSTRNMFEKHDLYREAEGIKTNVRGQNFIDVEIVLNPPDERDMTAREIISLWRDEIGDIQGVDQITFEAERGPGGAEQDISIDISHTDIEILEKASQAFMDQMKSYQETRDINDNFNIGKLQYDFRLLPEGRSLGLTPSDVGNQLRDAFYGALAMRQLRGTNEIEVRVKLPLEERKDEFNLEELVIQTPDGIEVPLLDVASLEQSEAFLSINRRDGRRVVTVGMDIEPPGAVSRVMQSITSSELPQLRADFPGTTWSFRGTQADMRESTSKLWSGFVLAMLIIYALLAIAFNNYIQPLIVMAAIPFGVVGAVIGHILLGYDLSLVSLMGVIALSGVVVNDSLIMIDFANKKRKVQPAFDAIHEAGVRRFRPIILTTITTFGGLTPIILESSQQALYLIPMAISLGFGIIFATSIILIIVPCLYMIFDDAMREFQKFRKPAPAA